MTKTKLNADIAIIGAGAAGLFCAAQLGKAGLDVIVTDSGKRAGRKIIMSGGGRCNFTNLHIEAKCYLSSNRHFCKSALARFTQWDFIDLVNQHGIAYHEKGLGQLFCDDDAKAIVELLLSECRQGNVRFAMQNEVSAISSSSSSAEQFTLQGSRCDITAKRVVVATGGLSMPKLGVTPIGYQIAKQFGHSVLPTRAGLVPFTLDKPLLDKLSELSGIAVPVSVEAACGMQFKESLLFTHRGLSGPAILQISNYWQPGEYITVDLLPEQPLPAYLHELRAARPNLSLKNALAQCLPKRVVECLAQLHQWPDKSLKQLNDPEIAQFAEQLHQWRIQPNGTEGYRTAEVTLGGVNVDDVSSKTMESNKCPGLYFIGEVLDVTGWLGGYNFQWAWSSAYACASAIIAQ